MAQFFTDFSDETLGVSPSSITAVFGSMGSDIISGNALGSSDRCLELTHSGGGFAREAVSWLAGTIVSDSRTTVQIFAEFAVTVSGGSESIPGPLLNGSGDQSTRTGYVQWFRDDHTLRKYDNGVGSSLASETLFLPSLSIQRRLELRRDGDVIEVRHWIDGNPRPSTPNIEYTDPSPLAASGFVGVSNLAKTNGQTIKVFSIAVGTNGDPAPSAPTPANPTVTRLQATRARLGWSAG